MQRIEARGAGILLAAAVVISISGCSSGGGGDHRGPLTVSDVTATSERSGEVTVDWSPMASATGYVLYWSNTPGLTKATAIRIGGVTPPYVHLVPANGTGYFYAVAAVTPSGEEPLSLEVLALPLDPPAFTGAQAGTGEISLQWTTPSGADSHDLYWSAAPGVTVATATLIPGVSSGFVHPGLSNGIPYYYALLSRNSLGGGARSSLSGEISATPILAPTGVTATAGDASVSLAWSNVTGATSYNVYWSAAPGVTKATGGLLPGVSSPHDHTGLANGTPYYYVVAATNASGESVESQEVSATPQAAPALPQPPTGVTATPGATWVTIDWNLVAGALSFNVYWANAPGVTKTNGTQIPGAVAPHDHSFLTGGLAYYYVVTTVDAVGESAESLEVSATPPGAPPGRPTALRARPGDTEVIVEWRDVNGATSYNLYWDTVTGVTPATGTPIAGVSSPHVHTGLTNGTTYYYVVTAVGPGGEGTYSSQASATPQANGVVDGSFGAGGVLVHNGAAGGYVDDRGYAIAVDGTDRILVAGYSTNIFPDRDMAVWRLNDDGTLDVTFNGQGWVVHDDAAGGGGDDEGHGILVDLSSGRILVTGQSWNARGDDDMVLWAFDSSGALDGTFGTGGVVVHDNAAGGSGHDRGRGIAIDAAGGVLVAGSSFAIGGDDLALWRFDAAGALDPAFGSGGVALHHNAGGGNADDIGEAVAVEASGRIVVAGRSDSFGNDHDMALWRFDSAGALDATFGTSGYVTHNSAGGDSLFDSAYSIALDGSGNLYAGGRSDGGFNHDLVIWSYDGGGIQNGAFGVGGIVVTPAPAGPDGNDSARSIVIDSSGRILVAGHSVNWSNTFDMTIIRYDVAGNLDGTFGTGGVAAHDSAAGGFGHDYGRDMVLDALGRILVTGYSPNRTADDDMVVWRFKP